MKLSKKNTSLFALMLFLGLIAGTLTWELLERILQTAGVALDLGIGPLGIDLDVIAVYVKMNPGSLLGAGTGVFVFGRL